MDTTHLDGVWSKLGSVWVEKGPTGFQKKRIFTSDWGEMGPVHISEKMNCPICWWGNWKICKSIWVEMGHRGIQKTWISKPYLHKHSHTKLETHFFRYPGMPHFHPTHQRWKFTFAGIGTCPISPQKDQWIHFFWNPDMSHVHPHRSGTSRFLESGLAPFPPTQI